MTRRVIAIVLTAAAIGWGQGSVLYGAVVAPPGSPAVGATADAAFDGGLPASFAVASAGLSQAGAASIECLRGGYYQCFGIGSYNCCGELFVLMAIAGAAGVWPAAGLAAWGYWYWC